VFSTNVMMMIVVMDVFIMLAAYISFGSQQITMWMTMSC